MVIAVEARKKGVGASRGCSRGTIRAFVRLEKTWGLSHYWECSVHSTCMLSHLASPCYHLKQQ